MEYTKGEWKRRNTETSGLVFCNGWLVADIGATPRKVENKEESALYYKEQVANANLISSAPELYRTLKALVDHFRANDENYYKSDLCTDALQALLKAEGK